jgi:hypothetical protein
MTNPIRIVSYGGGVQSTALLVLAAQGRIDFQTFVMSNVGDDSEHPATLEYVRNVAMPYAKAHGIELHEIDRVKRDGTTETLYGRLTKEGSRSLPIPVRMSNGAPGTRSCTSDFKIKVIGKWLKEHGATGGKRCRTHKAEDSAVSHLEDEPAIDLGPRPDCAKCVQPNIATVGIGISVDEIQRASTRHVESYENVVYPLVGIGEETGLKLNRSDCQHLIAQAGLPVPPKSSCYFCPFHKPAVWADMRRTEPDLFEKSAALEDTLNDRRRFLGKDEVFLTRFGIPLRDAIKGDEHEVLFELDDNGTCDSGWCMT